MRPAVQSIVDGCVVKLLDGPWFSPFTNGGLIPLTGTASSGLPVSYKSGNAKVLTIAGTNCLITGKGTTTVVATQAGGTNYLAAPSVTNTVNVQ